MQTDIVALESENTRRLGDRSEVCELNDGVLSGRGFDLNTAHYIDIKICDDDLNDIPHRKCEVLSLACLHWRW